MIDRLDYGDCILPVMALQKWKDRANHIRPVLPETVTYNLFGVPVSDDSPQFECADRKGDDAYRDRDDQAEEHGEAVRRLRVVDVQTERKAGRGHRKIHLGSP
jgi:hypothetical protein